MGPAPARGSILAGRSASRPHAAPTGGSGIGYTITEAFLRHGASCFIVSRSKDRIEAAVRSLRNSAGGRVSGLSADVRDPARMKEVAEACVRELGSLDVLVNSTPPPPPLPPAKAALTLAPAPRPGAAGNFLCPASSMSSRAFRAVLEIDTVGTFHATRAAFDAWMSDHGGVVLSITATLHWNAMPMQCHAGSAKAGIEALMRHLAIEWGPLGIRTACVAPGPIKDTEGYSRLGACACACACVQCEAPATADPPGSVTTQP